MTRWERQLRPVVQRLGLDLRQEDPEADAVFLDHLYATTRAEELAQTGWSAAEVQRFLHDQSRLQRAHYREHYPEAAFLLILADGDPVGRVYLDERADELRLMDIALLPEWRRAGRGSAILRALQEQSRTRGLTITLHVEPFNPASRLYRKLGFDVVETRGVYQFMRWVPA